MLCRYIFVIIDSDRLYSDRTKGEGYRRTDHLWEAWHHWWGIQTFINISVTTMIFPNTGLSLPFVSYGLTSIVCFYMGIGFVLNVGLQPNKYQ